ncbi:MAG: hypothetical protein ABJH28_10850 [Paraglaciecola sp.]|uniref:hypothetical protein n=1 Tax=Paraglaciecola sp. TaxID=1920173 RepID=UPI003265A299
MSLKINVLFLVKEHFLTLKHDGTGKISFTDLFSFVALPIFLSGATIFFEVKLSADFTDAVINFGAIFSALLMSVLVLVYDQDAKLNDVIQKAENNSKAINKVNLGLKKELLKQLYHNICFAIVASLSIVVLSLVQILAESYKWIFVSTWIITPFIIFFLCSMILTTLMVVKRMHALLESNIHQ